ncbi:MAG: peptidylprolyl isomerase [Chthoniobacterales bacterium]
MNRFCLPLLALVGFASAVLAVTNKPPVANQVSDLTVYNGVVRSVDLLQAFTDPDGTAAVRMSVNNFGNIDVILYGKDTPLTVANFLRYVDEGRYFYFDQKLQYLAQPVIHRSVYDTTRNRAFVIQGGGYFGDISPIDKATWQAIPLEAVGNTLPPIKNEPGISNTTGTIAMAKAAPQYNADGSLVAGTGPHSATSQWFINLGDNGATPYELDNTQNNGGYAVFGRLVGDSLNVAFQINALPRYGFTSALDSVPLRNYSQSDYNAFITPPGDSTKAPKVVPNVVTMSSIAQIPPMTFTASSNNTAVADVSIVNGQFLHVTPKTNGTARITVSATDLDGASISQSFNVNVITAPGRLVNISTRLQVGTGQDVLIGGFIVRGSGTKRLMIRGIGPSITSNGQPLAGTLQDPTLELHDGSGAIIASNDNWQTNSNKAEISDTGIAPSAANESVILTSVPADSAGTPYTAVLKGVNNGTGIGLVEVYDLDSAPGSTVLNISTRGFVQAGDNVMIGGFIVGGTDSKKILVRGIGPSLTNNGVAGALADPQLELHNAQGTQIDSNDDWQSSPQKTEIQATGVPPSNAKESATYDVLAPGAYTAIVRGAGSTTGVALVEVYQLP